MIVVLCPIPIKYARRILSHFQYVTEDFFKILCIEQKRPLSGK